MIGLLSSMHRPTEPDLDPFARRYFQPIYSFAILEILMFDVKNARLFSTEALDIL